MRTIKVTNWPKNLFRVSRYRDDIYISDEVALTQDEAITVIFNWLNHGV